VGDFNKKGIRKPYI